MNILDIAIAKQLAGGGGGSGTDNYNELSNLPKINGTTLSGDKSSSSLGLQSEIKEGAELASDLVDDSVSDNKFVTSAEKLEWSGKQNLIDSSHKLSSDLVNDADKMNKFVTASEKETWNGKQNLIDNSHKLSSDLVDDTNKTNKFVTSTEKNTWNAKQNAIDSDHKLSSSLVSFTEAETAALASGIDSTKVGQISTNQTNILYNLNMGVKNLLYNDGVTDYISQGVTYTFNKDGSVRIKGTVPSGVNSVFYYFAGSYRYVSNAYKGYILSGVTNGGDSTYALAVSYSNDGTAWATSAKQTTTPIVIGNYDYIIIQIVVYSGTTVDTTIYPMLCTPEAWAQSHDFMPPALPNYDLTRLESEDRASLAEVVDSGAKNLLNNSLANGTVSQNVTATVASNGSFTLSGTASTNTDATFPLISNTQFKAGNYVGTGCPKNGDIAKYRIDYVVNDSTVYRDYGDGVEFTLTSAANVRAQAVVYRNTAAPSGTWYPMLCTKAAFGVSNKFVPYRPSWDVIADSIKTVQIANSDFITVNTNFTILSQSTLFKHGSQVFGTLVIQKTDTAKFADSLAAVGTIKSGYRPIVNLIGQSYYNTEQWGVNGFGYSYINTSGTVSVKSSTDSANKYSYVSIPINYMTA